MKPEIELLADLRNLGKRIGHARADGAGCPDDEKGMKTSSAILCDLLAQLVRAHAKLVVGCNPANRRGAQTGHIGRLVDPRMHLGRPVKNEASALGISDALRANVPCRLRSPRDEEADDVRHVPAAHQHTIPLARQSHELREPADRFVLDFGCDR